MIGVKAPIPHGLTRFPNWNGETPQPNIMSLPFFFAHFSCTLLFKVYIFENAIYLDNFLFIYLLSKPGDLVYCQNPISGISHLLLIRFWPNLKGRFLGPSSIGANCYGGTYPGNICPHDICPYKDLLTISYLLLLTCYFVTRYFLFASCYLLFATYYLLHATC